MKASETTLGKLLQGQCQYLVPLYQRPYSWDRSNLRQLWADVMSVVAAGPSATHFMGSLVLAPSPSTTPAGVAIWLVVDGQQRLTALSVLLCAMRDHVRGTDPRLADKIDDLYLLNRYAAGNERYTLLPTRADRAAWTTLLEASPEAGGRTGVGEAYQFFRKELAALADSEDPVEPARIEQAVVGQLAVVEIAAHADDDVYRIFESLNHTGRRLTQADLLRNYLFMRLPTRADHVYDWRWYPLQELLGRDLEDLVWLDLVLRGDDRATKEAVYQSQRHFLDTLPDEDAVERWIHELHEKALLFKRILSPDQEPDRHLRSALWRLHRWGADVVRPIALHLLMEHAAGRIEATEAARALRVVESYLIRRMLVGVASANSNRILMSLVKELGETPPTADAITRVLSGPRKKFPSDEHVREAVLVNPFYWTGRGPQRTFVLRCLEEDHEHLEPIDWEAKLTIEHVLPQSLSRPGWQRMLDDELRDGESRDELHRSVVHTLGNLTLTAYNPKLADHEFDHKRKLLADSGLVMNREISCHHRWGRTEIQQRGRSLADRILRIWPGPDTSVEMAPPSRRWALLTQVLASIPAGRWTSYSDVAEVVGTHAVAVGQRLANARVPHAHRVMRLDGTVSPEFRWPDPDRTDDPILVLTTEGVIFTRSGKALPRQRMTAAELVTAADLVADGAADTGRPDTSGNTTGAGGDGAGGGEVSVVGGPQVAGTGRDDVGERDESGPVYAERVRGCLLGGALGDALGASIEFSDLAEIRRRNGPAGVTGLTAAFGVRAPLTDDTQMTLFTAEGLIRASVRSRSHGSVHPPTVLWNAYQRWLVTQNQAVPSDPADGWLSTQKVLYARRAPGNACLSGLERTEPGTVDRPANPDSKGCGAVMRSAPFGLLHRTPESSWDLAVECAVLTHGHPSGYLAAGAYAWIIAEIVQGASVTDAAGAALERLSAEKLGGEVSSALRAALGAAVEGAVTPERVESLGAGWVAEEALAIAVYCAAALPDDPCGALLAAVNHSGDSDSTGAMCGSLVGAALGEKALPHGWLSELEGLDVVRRVADDFVREIQRPRSVSDPFGAATSAWQATYPGN